MSEHADRLKKLDSEIEDTLSRIDRLLSDLGDNVVSLGDVLRREPAGEEV